MGAGAGEVRLVIVDRDGVINYDSPDHIRSPEEWVPIPGSLDAIARLNRAGYRVMVATNQSGLGRGLFDIGALTRIHHKMQRLLAEAGASIEAVFFCPHTPADDCPCRKPRPGLLRDIRRRLGVDLAEVVVVGDTLADVEAAVAAGARPVLVQSGKERISPEALSGVGEDVPVYDDLAGFVDAFLHAEPARRPSA